MTVPAPAPAANVSVARVLSFLEGSFSSFFEGVAAGRYALWLGSGISRERVADVGELVTRVFTHLQANSDFTNVGCEYRKALNDAIGLALLSDADRAAIDATTPFSSWDQRFTIVANVARKYAELLDIVVSSWPEEDHILWNVVDVRSTYADPALKPDCEHLAIAVLMLEGVISEVATANWDGLNEAAIRELFAEPDSVRVCVRASDFQGSGTARSRLNKFHGCAVLARSDEAVYRSYLIGKRSQITDWPNVQRNEAMREELIRLAGYYCTLMVGMSAQDTDIQDVFSRGKVRIQRTWPADPPAHVFAEQALDPMQTQILKVVYGSAYLSNKVDIDKSAHFPAFGKPLLTALVLQVLHHKLSAIANAAWAGTPLGTGLRRLRDRLAAGVGDDKLAFMKAFIARSRLALAVFREFDMPLPDDAHYRALSGSRTESTLQEPNIVTSGLPELAIALDILGDGDERSDWTMNVPATFDPDAGVLGISSVAGDLALFFVAGEQQALKLETSGIAPQNRSDAVLVYSTSLPPPSVRSSRAAFGRTGMVGRRNISMAEILHEAPSFDDARIRFREAATI